MSISNMEVSLYPGFAKPSAVAKAEQLKFVVLKKEGETGGEDRLELVLANSTVTPYRHADMMKGLVNKDRLLAAGIIERPDDSLLFCSTDLKEAAKLDPTIQIKPADAEAQGRLRQQIKDTVRAWLNDALATEVTIS